MEAVGVAQRLGVSIALPSGGRFSGPEPALSGGRYVTTASRMLVVLALAVSVMACAEPKREWVRVPSMAGVPGDPDQDNAQCAYEARGPVASTRNRRGRSSGIRAPGMSRPSVERCMRDRGWRPKDEPG